MSNTSTASSGVVGMWATEDGYIRTGTHSMTGSHLGRLDDTGSPATGDICDGVLHHEHLGLFREERI